jgi:nicotinate-nucleotide adenylyltransferase
MARIGILGGTFDPPHIAHLILASEAQHQLELACVLWVLTPDPPHKPGRSISHWPVRLEMLQAAIQDNPLFEISRVEIDRPPPHYAFETVQLLRQGRLGDVLVYLMGGDELRDLGSWKEPQKFLAACDEIGVMRRPGDAVDLSVLEGQLPGLTDKVQFMAAPLLEISASEIRRRAGLGQPIRYFLPREVHQIIESRNLYGAGGFPD